MEWKLYKTAVACTFGHDSPQPMRKALLRLISILFCSIGLGSLLAYSLLSLPALPTATPVVSALLLIVGTQACVLLVLFSAGALQRTASFERLLLFWPLPIEIRWRVYVLPGIILGGFALALTTPSLAVVVWRSGLSPLFIPLCCSLGLIAAVAGFYGLHHLRASRLAAASLILAAEYWLARQSEDSPIAAALGLSAIIIALSYLFHKGAAHLAGSLARPGTQGSTAIGARTLPRTAWLIKTALRNRPFRTSLLTNTGLSLGLSLLLSKMPGGIVAAPFAASLLVATFTSDIRSLARRYQPAEITAIRGTLFFLQQELLASAFLGTIVVLPLLAILSPTPTYFFQFIASISTGLFAGSLLAPTQRDITGQGLASLCCIAMLAFPAQLAGAPSLSNTQNIILFSVITTVTSLASCFIEYKRNPYLWRKHALQKARTTI